MEQLVQDVRFALRNLAKSPAVTVAALVALALGIGANTALFSVLDGVLIEPLPYPDPDRIVLLLDHNHEAGFPRFSSSPPNFVDWREQSRSFAPLAAFGRASVNLTGEGLEPERLAGTSVTADFFAVAGVEPALGRTIHPDEARPGGEKVVVLSHGLWQRRFGADPEVLGRTVTLDGELYSVVGVMPQGFSLPRETDLWVPMDMEITENMRGAHFIRAIGRLAPGVSLEQAQTEMDGITRRLEEQYPNSNTGWGVAVHPMKDLVVEDVKPALLVLMAAVGFVLLIACANVANVLLARMAGREREVAVRGALGAGRGRLVRQFLTESVLLALGGGALGVLGAALGTRALLALSAGSIPRAEEVGLDWTVLAFALAVSLATGVLFGLGPALKAARGNLQGALKEGGRSGESRRTGLARSALVLAEVALAVVLLVGAGLLLRSFSRLAAVSPGFEPAGALTLTLQIPEARYPEEPQQAAFWRQLMPRVRALPGVEAAGAAFPLPLSGAGYVLTFNVAGRPEPPPNQEPSSNIRFVTPGYLEAMEIPLLRGRTVTDADDEGAPPVALVNQTMANRMWPEKDPLGARITFNDPADPEARWWTVVGVVGDVLHDSLAGEPEMETYLPLFQSPDTGATLVVRSAGAPGLLAGPVREVVRELDSEVPLYRIRTLEELVRESLSGQRFSTTLLGVFAVVALLLAAVGIYGVVSYAVSRRTHEVGLRMALGAQPGEVLRLVVRQGMTPVVLGVAVGVAAAPLLARSLESLLYGVESTDPATLVAVPVLLAAVALVASLLPSLKATRVDPAVALRVE